MISPHRCPLLWPAVLNLKIFIGVRLEIGIFISCEMQSAVRHVDEPGGLCLWQDLSSCGESASTTKSKQQSDLGGGGALLLSSKISSLCKIFLETVSHNPLSVLKDNSDFKTVELLFDLYCALHYLFLMIWNYNSGKKMNSEQQWDNAIHMSRNTQLCPSVVRIR